MGRSLGRERDEWVLFQKVRKGLCPSGGEEGQWTVQVFMGWYSRQRDPQVQGVLRGCACVFEKVRGGEGGGGEWGCTRPGPEDSEFSEIWINRERVE